MNTNIRSFMLGWEFPPFISGGLGTACYGLTKAMSKLGTQIIFVLPRTSHPEHETHVKMLSAKGHIKTSPRDELKNIRFKIISSALKPYTFCGAQHSCLPLKKKGCAFSWQNDPAAGSENYSWNMLEEVQRYADKAVEIADAENFDFDIVHAHDWMTFPAAMAVTKTCGKPLIVHIHSTEFDRSGENVNQKVYDFERQGMHQADKIITVSNYTKSIIVKHYDIAPDKVEVVYNAVENNACPKTQMLPRNSDKIVLFLGRITMQKGPEYFIAAAKKVSEKLDNVKFIMAGDGDMTNQMIEYAAYLGIGHKVFFTRFLKGPDVDRAYRMADLYVMPSVSEPFGIAPLEALKHNVPALVSKQSGVSEILSHVLKVDFWDINQMADKMVAVLKHSPLSSSLRENGCIEASKIRWEDAAAKVGKIYEQLLACA